MMRLETKGMMAKLGRGLGALAALSLAAACSPRHHHHDDDGCWDCCDGGPRLATVDSDFILNTDLGWGAGLFVEYTRGGLWTFWTSCDTELYGYACYWDVEVFSHSTIGTLDLYGDGEGGDEIYFADDRSFGFHVVNTFGSDVVEMTAAPGALIDVYAYLDGYYAPTYVTWHGNGAVRTGGPCDEPLVFQPDAP